MNHLHLQEAAKHYAKLAEEAQKNLEQEKELNEDLLTIIDALCEELGIDAEDLLDLDEATRAEIKRDRAHEAKFEKIRAGNKKYLRSNLKNVKKAGHKDGLTKLGLDYGT